MHGLVSETSICYWQGQPESYIRRCLLSFIHSTMAGDDDVTGGGGPPPRSPWPPCRWLGKYCYSSFLSSSSSFSPCRYGVHVWRHHRFPFLRGRGATISCGQVSPLGCIVARVGSPIKAPTCAASATVGGRSSPFAAL